MYEPGKRAVSSLGLVVKQGVVMSQGEQQALAELGR